MISKKGFTIQELLPIGMAFVVLTIGLAIGLQVTGDVRNDMCDTDFNTTSNSCNAGDELTAEFNATEDGIGGLAKIPEKLPLIATVVAAAVLIGIIVKYLMYK